MPPLSVLVVDDEPLARERLRALLDDAPEVKIVGECASGRTAVKAIQEKRPDLVFLDVQMPGLDGFGVVEQIGAAKMPAIVFVTAFDQYALKAFEIHALDYLLKPFDRERFEATLARAREAIRLRTAGSGGAPPPWHVALGWRALRTKGAGHQSPPKRAFPRAVSPRCAALDPQ